MLRCARYYYTLFSYLLSYFGGRASQVHIVEQKLAAEYSDMDLV